jgi:uncharacterized repeat protein (TIGR01451 family)
MWSQQQPNVPQYLEFDDRILVLREFLRQNQIEMVRSERVDFNEWYADVYVSPPPSYFPLAPFGAVMQFPSETSWGHRIYVGPDRLYMINIYDFEHDLIIEAGEWKDLNGNYVAEDSEWFDENGNGVRNYGEWIDANANGFVDLNELNDLNGNGVFDIGEWHEGKDTDGDPRNNLPGEFNGAVDPNEWIGMDLDRSITKKLALKIYKRIIRVENTYYYKEVDYEQYINPTFPERVFQHPALRAATWLTDNQKLVFLLRLQECERCEIVGDVAWYEDEFARIVFNFQGFFRETLHTTLPRCEGCFEATVSHYAKLQIYVHEKYDLLYENFYLHDMEKRGLPDNRDGTTAYYYTALQEMTRADEYRRRIRSLVSFDPYYIAIRDDNELVLFETIYGKALIVPYDEKEEEYGSHIYKRKYPDGTEGDIRVELIHVYQIETIDCEQVIVARLLIDEDTDTFNTPSIDPDEKIYTIFYYACEDYFENNIIFPEEYEEGISDFAIIVEKIELENEKVWLKFVREVDSDRIPNPAGFSFGTQDYQIVFDELDRDRPLGMCDFYPKDERNVPRFEKILVDVCLPYRQLLNNVVLKYEDLKGNPNELASYEEQPWEMGEWNTEVTVVQLKKIAYNPNAADYTGLGYPDVPVYVAPLDAAPGLVPTDTDFDLVDDTLLPNFQVSDEDFSGTCVPGDVITFYIEVYNGSGGPLAVQVRDDIPIGTYYNPATCLPPSAPGVIVDTTGDAIIGNGGDTIVWDLPNLPPGYTLLSYEVEVLADGTINFGGSVVNSNAVVYYYEQNVPRVGIAPTVTIDVQAAQIIKEAFADLACTIPAPTIVPGSRLYYRLTVYNTIDPASPNLYTAQVVEIFDIIPANTTNPQYHVSPPGLAPQPIIGNTVSWQGVNLLGPGTVINAIYSVFVPLGSAGRITNNAQLTYDVAFPPAAVTTVTTSSNTVITWIITALTQITEPLEPCVWLKVDKDGPPWQAAGTIHYEITVTNMGNGPYADAFNIVIIDKVPQYVSAPYNITSTNPLVIFSTHDSDGDFVDDTIVWKLDQLPAGADFRLEFDVDIQTTQIPYNSYILKVFTSDLYQQEDDRYLGMGAISRAGNYKFTPEDMTAVIKDAVFTQVMDGAEKLENYLIKIFESRFYNRFYFEFADFNDKERSARFKLFKSVNSNLDINVYWGILEQISMDTGSSQIHSGDTFLAHILLRNDGYGEAAHISYELDAPDFAPVDMTWVYNIEQFLELEIAPGEQAGLLFLMKAPSVSHETTFPVKVKITYSDGGEIRTETKTAYLNVLSQRRANINIQKNILEGKSVVKETGKEVADMRVGEERTVVAYIKNLSEDTLDHVHYIDDIPRGLEVIEGKAEWMGTLEPGEVVKVTYKIKVKQIGIYQFRGRIFYKDERNHIYEGVSNITEIRVITEPGPKLRREIDDTNVAKGDTMTVVIRVENDTPNLLEHIQVVDIIPEGFTVEKLETKGLEEEDGTVRFYIDELKSEKYILLKHTLRAGEKAGSYTYKGVRLAYENGDGLKEEILTEDQTVFIPETESPNLAMNYGLTRKVDRTGEYITVSVILNNRGGIAAKTTKIYTTILEGTEFVEASTDYLLEGNDITFTVDEIGAGEEYTVRYTIKVPHFNEDRSYTLTFNTLYSDDFDREYSAALEDEFTVTAQKPILQVTKVAEKSAVKLNFSVRVAVNIVNEGEIPAYTTVTDPLPEGMVLLSGTNEWEGSLEPGESAQVMYEMLCTRVGSIQLPPATAQYQDRWKIEYTAVSESEVAPPIQLNVRGILLEKTADIQSLTVGEVVVITVSVTNTYEERATNVSIDDSKPGELTLVEGTIGWKIPVLNAGETVTFMYSLKPETHGNFSLGTARATFIDVYNDKHESVSQSLSINVEPREPLPEETETPTPTTPPEEEGLGRRLAGAFTMMMAFLLIERRRTEEEVLAEELPPPPREREVIWKKGEEEKPVLPSAEERAEVMEEITPLDVIGRRREKIEESREKVGEGTDVRDLLGKSAKERPGEVELGEETERGFEEEPEREFREETGIFGLGEETERGFEEEPEREFRKETGIFGLGEETESRAKDDLGLEDLFAEEEPKNKENPHSTYTDVRDILRMTQEKPPRDSPPEFPTLKEPESENGDLPHIREVIKGPKDQKEEPKKSESQPTDEFDPRDIIKKKD